jgi:hypothetical protein
MCRGRAYRKLRRAVENNFFTQLAAHIMAVVDIRARVDVQYSSLAENFTSSMCITIPITQNSSPSVIGSNHATRKFPILLEATIDYKLCHRVSELLCEEGHTIPVPGMP